jgi:hypothetical protein
MEAHKLVAEGVLLEVPVVILVLTLMILQREEELNQQQVEVREVIDLTELQALGETEAQLL